MRLLACFSAALLAAGCEQAPIFRLTVPDPDARWFRGQQIVRRESDAASVAVSFQRSWGPYLVFDVAVVNRSDSTLLIAPEDFRFVLARSQRDLPGTFSALDPELELARLDREVAKENADYATGATLHVIGDVLDAVLDVAQARSRSREEQDRDAELDLEREIESREFTEDHEMAVARAAERRDDWSSLALRRTHIDPGQAITGKVVFSTEPLRASAQVETLTLYAPRLMATQCVSFLVQR